MKPIHRRPVMLLLCSFLLCGCADSSDSMDAQSPAGITLGESSSDSTGETLGQSDILEMIPETLNQKIMVGDQEQIIDAEIIAPQESQIMKGTLEKRDFLEEEQRAILAESSYIEDVNSLNVTVDNGFMDIRDTSYSKNLISDKDVSSDFEAHRRNVDEMLAYLDIQQIWEKGTLSRGDVGEICDFKSVGQLHGLLMEMKAEPVEFCGYGRMVEGKLVELCIQGDYVVVEEEEAPILEFSLIMEAFEELHQSGRIQPVPSKQAIERIRLCYMVKKTGGTYSFYPVWNFEVPYTADWLKGATGPHAERYVVLDACTGELVEYHIGGVE